MSSSGEHGELLAAVEQSTARAAASRKQADEDSAVRRDAIAAALAAGIARDEIAKAAGTHRNQLYKIAARTTGSPRA